ncbi:cell wall protein AWA1-like [Patiria miniata]|uniref:SEA domain-containing protein n=1 Tax=Patiria miniata TaxID=46514 RepID=A0A914A409_PATMI|nr:cell wall protein AWA1-like [Patiria miniata]
MVAKKKEMFTLRLMVELHTFFMSASALHAFPFLTLMSFIGAITVPDRIFTMEKSALIFILVAVFLVPDIIAQNTTEDNTTLTATTSGSTTAEPTTLGTNGSSVTTGVNATTENTTSGGTTVSETPEGSTTESGAPTGGTTDSCSPSGGATTSDTPEGGTTDSGSPTGGATDSGTPAGGTTDSGTPAVGTTDSGTPAGGATDSGTVAGGTADSGTDEPTEKPGTNASTEAPGTNAPTETPGMETKPPVKKFAGDLPITQINGTEVEFTSEYENSDSKPYKDLSVAVCDAVTTALENSTLGSSIEGCSVSGFRSGSIVATFLLEFPADTNVTPEELVTTLKDAFENSTDPRIAFLTVDTSSISVKEVIPTTEVIPSTVTPTEGPGGLSPGAIAGIVVGCVAAVAIIVVLIVCLVVKNKERSSKVQDVEEQELTRPSSRGKSLPPDRVSNASDK